MDPEAWNSKCLIYPSKVCSVFRDSAQTYPSPLYPACHLLMENSVFVTFISLPPLTKSCGWSFHSLGDVDCPPEHFLQCHHYLRTYFPTVKRNYIIMENGDRAEDIKHIDFCCVYLSLSLWKSRVLLILLSNSTFFFCFPLK